MKYWLKMEKYRAESDEHLNIDVESDNEKDSRLQCDTVTLGSNSNCKDCGRSDYKYPRQSQRPSFLITDILSDTKKHRDCITQNNSKETVSRINTQLYHSPHSYVSDDEESLSDSEGTYKGKVKQY